MQVGTYLKISVAVAVATIALKTGAWWVSGSVSLLSDALESLVNLAGAMFALAMVTIAARPADDDHPYGHHKAEYFSSGFEGVLIFAAALAIIWAAVQRLIEPQPLEDVGLGLVLSVVSSAMNGVLAWSMLRKARAVRSMALEGDARHLFTDVWTSAGVVAGLLAATATGWLWLDPVIAIAVALNILREGARLVAASASGLMDEAIEPEAQAEIDKVLAGFAHQAIRFDHVSTRKAGQRRFVDMHMHMPAGWTLGRAAALRTSVEQALMSAVPGLRATIQLLPMDVEAHFDDPRDLWCRRGGTAACRRLAPAPAHEKGHREVACEETGPRRRPGRGVTGACGQSAYWPAALMAGPHLPISASTNFLCSAGLTRPSVTMTAPSASWRLMNSGSLSAVRSAALSWSTTALGVPLGAYRPCQIETLKPLRPCESSVGSLDSAGVFRGCRVVTA